MQLTVRIQAQTTTNLEETRKIAESNARSVQAWEAVIQENRDESEEERSRMQLSIRELEQASRENSSN